MRNCQIEIDLSLRGIEAVEVDRKPGRIRRLKLADHIHMELRLAKKRNVGFLVRRIERNLPEAPGCVRRGRRFGRIGSGQRGLAGERGDVEPPPEHPKTSVSSMIPISSEMERLNISYPLPTREN